MNKNSAANAKVVDVRGEDGNTTVEPSPNDGGPKKGAFARSKTDDMALHFDNVTATKLPYNIINEQNRDAWLLKHYANNMNLLGAVDFQEGENLHFIQSHVR